MRRKLFFCAFMIIVLTFIVCSIYQEYSQDDIKNNLSETILTGKVISIQDDSDKTKLVIEKDDGERVLVSYYGQQNISNEWYGSLVKIPCKLELPRGQSNPRCFDYKLYLKSQKISYITSADTIYEMKKTDNLYDKFCKGLLIKKEQFLNSISDTETRAFVEGILFGNKANLDEDVYEDFKSNGTAHILAVSGLHVGIIYKIVEKLLGKVQKISNGTISIAVLWCLGILTGWTPSVIRAVGMIYIKLYALYFDKRYDSLTAMAATALFMIAKNPYVVFNASFQMSYMAVLSIMLVMPHIPKVVPDFLAIIVSVNVGLIPYQLLQFNTFSITSFIANVPVVYLAGITLPIIFVFFCIFMLTGLNIGILEVVVNAVSKFTITANELFTFELDAIDVVSPPMWLCVLIYGVIFLLFSEYVSILKERKEQKKLIIIIAFICFASIGSVFIFHSDFDEADIVFVDVGQGDCIHLKAGDKNILIDGGGKSDYSVGKNILKPYLLKNGAKTVDLAIATHKHMDHYKGLEELVEEGMAKSIEVGLTAGKRYRVSENVTIDTLWPLEISGGDVNQDENKNCSVFMITYNKTKILITGDLDSEGEKEMMEYYGDSDILKADILKIGHHGSQYSTSEEFLEKVDPVYSIIQVGRNNYGHPHAKTIEKIRKKGIILRNDENGAVGFNLEKGKIECCTMM